MVTVGHRYEVHLLFMGLVDAHEEIERLNELIGDKQSSQRKLLENTQRPLGLCGEAMGLMWGGHWAYLFV